MEHNTSGYYKFYWKLENFCFCNLYCNLSLSSPTFQIDGPFRSKWSLYMFPNGWGLDKYIGIFLKREADSGPKEITVLFKICLVDNSGVHYLGSRYSEKVFSVNEEWGYNEFVKRRDITPNSEFLVNNRLTIFCDFTILDTNNDVRSPPHEETAKIEDFEDASSVCKAMKCMYKDSIYSDITLHGHLKDFRVHRCILGARLPNLLRNLMHLHNKVYSNDDATDKMLLYAYTGELDLKGFGVLDIRKILEEYGLNNSDVEKRIMSGHKEFTAHTYFVMKRFKFSWKIRSSLLEDNDDDITSSMVLDDDIGFIAYLTKDEEDRYWKIYIKVMSDDEVFVKCKISLSGHVYLPEEFKYLVEFSSTDVQCVATIKLLDDVLYFNQKPAQFLREYFILKFDFTYPTDEINSSLETIRSSCESMTPSVFDDKVNLMKCLEALYSGRHEVGDITIKVGDSSREFTAHKCILSARSAVFRRMLEVDMVEKMQNKINMRPESSDLDDNVFADVVDKFLLYTYCGKLEAPDETFKQYLQSLIGMYFIGGQYEEV